LETLNLLALKLWFKNPARASAFSGRVFRDYMSLVGQDKWASRPIEQIFPGMNDCRIVLEHLPGDGVCTPIDELAYLALMTTAVQARNIFEIGTFRGRTALNFALNSSPDCVVHTLDLPPDQRTQVIQRTCPADAALIRKSEIGLYFKGRPEARKIRQLYGDSLKFDFDPFREKMDLVFIDGAHDYQTAKNDTKNALKIAAPGGWIVWHDFGNYGDYNDVTRAVIGLLPPTEVVQIDNSQLAVFQKPRQIFSRDG
jgi:predicted O-methyltransferase YrrM